MNISRYLSYALLCSAATLMLTACSSMMPESKTIEYKSEGKKLKPLDVPPDLVAPEHDSRYAVPGGTGHDATTFSAYSGERKEQQVAQGNSDVLPKVGNLHIEQAGSERWLVVPGVTPDKLWDTVKQFWQENGMLINVENPQTGIMETEWAENRAKIPNDGIRGFFGKALDSLYSTAERDKYRTRLEKGPDGSTEIYISHRGMYEVYINEDQTDTRWEPRPPDPGLEAEMLHRLMVRLGVEDSQAKTMLAAAPKDVRAKLNHDAAGVTTLSVDDAFDRAWRRVGLALDRVGFTVEDRDRAQGIYYVRYVDPDADAKNKKDTGFFSKMEFWKSSDKDAIKNNRYQIYIKGGDNSSTVQVLTHEGGHDTGGISDQILSLLYDQLK